MWTVGKLKSFSSPAPNCCQAATRSAAITRPIFESFMVIRPLFSECSGPMIINVYYPTTITFSLPAWPPEARTHLHLGPSRFISFNAHAKIWIIIYTKFSFLISIALASGQVTAGRDMSSLSSHSKNAKYSFTRAPSDSTTKQLVECTKPRSYYGAVMHHVVGARVETCLCISKLIVLSLLLLAFSNEKLFP